MTTWFDDYAYRTRCNLVLAKPALSRIDVRKVMYAYTAQALADCGDALYSADERAGLQFDADLLPFLAENFRFVRFAARVSPAMAQGLSGRASARDEIKSMADHLTERDFNYIDLPTGAFRIGADGEINALFVKIAHVVTDGSGAPTSLGLENTIEITAVIGTRGVFTRQRIVWRLGQSEIEQHVESALDDLTPRTPGPLELISSAGRDLGEIMEQVQNIAIGALAHGRSYSGTTLATPVAKIQDGHPTLYRTHPSAKRTLLDLVDLRAPSERAGKASCRGRLH